MQIYKRFIGGSTIERAVETTASHSWIPIFDRAAEGNSTLSRVNKYTDQILVDIDALEQRRAFIALKASSFGNEFEIDRIVKVVMRARSHGLRVLFDAETSLLTSKENAYINTLYEKRLPVFKTYQMYRKDGLRRLKDDLDRGVISRIKLVRGAYMHSEPDKSLLIDNKRGVDASFDLGVECVLSAMAHNPHMSVMVATHNTESVERVLEVDPRYKNQLYFAQLLGMADPLTQKLVDKGFQTCKYVPYGNMVECFPYLVRRLYENYGVLKYI
jgi:hypothetical protein